MCPHHRLQLCAGYHGVGQLHLLCQHDHVFLLDEVVPPVDLQLGLEVGRGMQVLTVLPGTAALSRW